MLYGCVVVVGLLVIGLCTGGTRPRLLARALHALGDVMVPEGLRVVLQVIDSSPDQAGYAVYTACRPALLFPSAYRSSGVGRIAARNALMEHTKALAPQYLACCDDDAAVDPQWLTVLYGVLRSQNADVVTDCIQVDWPGGVSAAVAHHYRHLLYVGRSRPRGAVWRVRFARTGNVLCRWQAIEGLRFSSLFAHLGEDTDFFYRLHRQGGRIYTGAWGLITEQWVAARAQFAFLWRRHYAIGVVTAKIYCRSGMEGWGFAAYECGGKCVLAFVRLSQAVGIYLFLGKKSKIPAWVRGWQGLFLLARTMGYLFGMMQVVGHTGRGYK